jgi:hypothetical protein
VGSRNRAISRTKINTDGKCAHGEGGETRWDPHSSGGVNTGPVTPSNRSDSLSVGFVAKQIVCLLTIVNTRRNLLKRLA